MIRNGLSSALLAKSHIEHIAVQVAYLHFTSEAGEDGIVLPSPVAETGRGGVAGSMGSLFLHSVFFVLITLLCKMDHAALSGCPGCCMLDAADGTLLLDERGKSTKIILNGKQGEAALGWGN